MPQEKPFTPKATTTRDPTRKKTFSWSYSKLNNFETCPKRHYHVDIRKDFKEEEGEALIWGNFVHKGLEERIGSNKPLPGTLKGYEDWALKMLAGKGEIFVEQKLAITQEFAACKYFADDAWYRCKGDVIKINGPVGYVGDWKTGKIIENSVQLTLTAATVFAHYPQVQRVRSEFIWLKENATTRVDVSREEMVKFWKGLWPRIETLQQASERNEYPPKPNGLCRNWCPVKSCPHNGV